jgi:hypothetical protein
MKSQLVHVCSPQSSKPPVFNIVMPATVTRRVSQVDFSWRYFCTVPLQQQPVDRTVLLYRTITSSSQYKGLWRRIFVFCEKYFETEIFCCKFPVLLKNIRQKIITIAYNMKGCLRFSTFIFWSSPKLTKCSYGWFPPEQHHKIEKKTLLWSH